MGAEPDADPLRVVACAVVGDDGRLLVVAKHAAPEVHYLPGGKPDAGETELEALIREVDEELGVAVVDPVRFTDVFAEATLERVPMHLVVYTASLDGTPAPAAEIASMRWWPADDGSIGLAPPIEHMVVPRLRAAGALPPAA
ncbi:MutT/NUDIX hydrolase [Baekduia alba]|uniref:NUDIX hydrolase n=1 Tax=Baekduia alba TaxID=2997333 RepID=UPI002341DA30|nr:NUDIX domain-containing protein [Baekduia alba]WCB93245.1 MutT/NUDIX hydrolase [Baekduia alba]